MLPKIESRKNYEMQEADRRRGVKFIHGFHGGTAIRDWMRSISLEQFMESANISGKISGEEDGTTCVSLTYN